MSEEKGNVIDDELLDTEQAALLLGLSPRTLERMRADRRGPSYVKLSARAIRYRARAVREWIANREVGCE